MVKVTFSLGDETVRTLRRVAERTNKAQSAIVREAIAEYAAREDMLSEAERTHKLGVIEALMAQPPTREPAAVDRELREIRRSRRSGWRRPRE